MKIILILPNSLFENNHLILKYPDHGIIIYEHPLFFVAHSYHKLKLILHRASMKYYQDFIKSKYNKTTQYINFDDKLILSKYTEIHCYDPVDYTIAKEFNKFNNVFLHNTPLFIETIGDLTQFHNKYPKAKHSTFYNWQKKNLNIIPDIKSTDKENRNKFPKDYKENYKIVFTSNKYVSDAVKYINKHFKDNFGESGVYFPVTHKDAKKHFNIFLKKRFDEFGTNQDAINSKIFLGNHSLLSPLLNIGLITPRYVINKILKLKNKIHINDLEAFIRQIIGWRSYVRYIYVFCRKQLIVNHFNHKNKLSNDWFNKINILPVDTVIEKVRLYGYAHHIERLMIVSNFMLLNEIDPKYVIEWFYKFIDAYPWVMEPNVYGMSQYASTIMMTRPYFSSSNYIIKMSEYKYNSGDKIKLKSGEYYWSEIWNALYYNFINNKQSELKKNYSTANTIKNLNKNKKLIGIAKEYIESYT